MGDVKYGISYCNYSIVELGSVIGVFANGFGDVEECIGAVKYYTGYYNYVIGELASVIVEFNNVVVDMEKSIVATLFFAAQPTAANKLAVWRTFKVRQTLIAHTAAAAAMLFVKVEEE